MLFFRVTFNGVCSPVFSVLPITFVPLLHCLALAPPPPNVCLSLLWIHLYQPISVSPQQIHNIRQHSTSGPPPLLLAPRASVPSVQIQGQRIIQQGLIRVANVPNAGLLVNIPQVSSRSPQLIWTAVVGSQATETTWQRRRSKTCPTKIWSAAVFSGLNRVASLHEFLFWPTFYQKQIILPYF